MKYIFLFSLLFCMSYINLTFCQNKGVKSDIGNFSVSDNMSNNKIIIGDVYSKGKYSSRMVVNAEVISLIRNERKKPYQIVSLLYRLNNNVRESIGVFEPCLYAVDRNDMLGIPLFKYDEYVKILEIGTEVVVVVDVRKYNLTFPKEGVFVGLKYIGDIHNGENDNNIIQKTSNNSFSIWNNEDAKGDKVSYFKYPISGKIEKEKPPNKRYYLFGIEVEDIGIAK